MLLEADDRAPGTVVDRDFIATHCADFDQYEKRTRAVDLDTVAEATGIDAVQLRRVAQMLIDSERTVACWAMGLTQHRHAVAMIAELTNLLLMRGMIGKPGAGVCPVRGHSNVQGDRTMGIWEQMPEKFLAALDARFGITSPRKHGLDTVDAIRAMRDGRAKVFMGMGGNFALATPDTAVTEAALRSCSLTVQVSTKLNRSHVVHGKTALILPSLGRTDRDVQASGKQQVSVEDSMSMVHLSRGSLHPPGEEVRSEVAIICQLARELLGPAHPVPWDQFNDDYDTIRDAIAAVVPGCANYNAEVRAPDGFQLPNGPRDSREFPTHTGKANFSVYPLEWVPVPEGRLVLQTLRSHDQYNTTIYGLDDRYRGVKGGRRVVFVNPRRHRDLRAHRGCSRRSGLGVPRRRRHDAGASGQGLPGGAVLDTGRQCRCLLPRDERPRRAGQRGQEVEHPGVEGGRHQARTRHGCKRSRQRSVMGRVTTRRRASHIAADATTTRPETLAVEEPLELRINGTAITVTMRTPGSDVELAQGFLLTEGVIGRREDIARVEYCRGAGDDGMNTYNVLDVRLAQDVPMPSLDVTRNFYTTSSCGVCGKGSIDAIRLISRHSPGDDPTVVTSETLSAMPVQLRRAQRIFATTGGLHGAALFDADGTMLVVREDIGRHNAVDKVIGWAVENGRIPLTGAVLLVSGRASFELTQKAVMAGIPVLAAVSAPSSLAVDLAGQAGLTLVAFLRGDSMNVYTRPDRIAH